jgi:hypothetical protein
MGFAPTPAQTLQSERFAYPGMLPREIIIFRAWLKIHEREYDRFTYNERVGPGHDPGPGWPENLRVMAISNSQKRVDAVAWSGNLPTLIEVKDRAGASSIGQLLAYYPLWNMEHPQLPPAQLLLVTNRIQTGIDIPCQFHGIRLDIVSADFSQLARDRRASPFLSPGRGGITNV